MARTMWWRVVALIFGLGLAYLTVVALVFANWTSADTAATWLRGQMPLLALSAVSGLAASALIVWGLARRRAAAPVVALGLAPVAVAVASAFLRY